MDSSKGDTNKRTVSVYGPFYIGRNCLQLPVASDDSSASKDEDTVKNSLDVSKYRIPTPKVGERKRIYSDHRINRNPQEVCHNSTIKNGHQGIGDAERNNVTESTIEPVSAILEQESLHNKILNNEGFGALNIHCNVDSDHRNSNGLKLRRYHEVERNAKSFDSVYREQWNANQSTFKPNVSDRVRHSPRNFLRMGDTPFKISSTEDNYVLNKYKSKTIRPIDKIERNKCEDVLEGSEKGEAIPLDTSKESPSPGKAYFSKHRLKMAKLKRKFFESLANKDTFNFSKSNLSNSCANENGGLSNHKDDNKVKIADVIDSPKTSENCERISPKDNTLKTGNKPNNRYSTESKATMLKKIGLPANDRYKRYSSTSILGDMSVFSAGQWVSGTRNEVVDYLAVVAIDFGTTYSGYAYSFTHDPEPVHLMRRQEGGDPGIFDQKVPTVILLDPEGGFHSFGYASRDFYHDLEPKEATKWMFFDRFKMLLHNEETLSKDSKLRSVSGREASAMKVFSYSLAYFKDLVIQELTDQSAVPITSDVIRWVITVPAIWKASAKQFMRQAAYEAGIVPQERPDQLLIALEPEAASIYCRRLRMLHLTSDDTQTSTSSLKTRSSLSLPDLQNESLNIKSDDLLPGTRYMVVDCGGGTVDITVHELLEGGRLKELHRASGGSHGSVGIDEEFERLLGVIFGEDIIEQFKLRRPSGWLDLLAVFESRKRTASPYRSSSISVSLPFSFIDFYKKCRGSSIESAVKKYGDPDITWSSNGMLRLAPGTMRRLFLSTVDGIKQAIGNVLNSALLQDLTYLFLVGGFAESSMVQHEIRKDFGDLVKVIIPPGVSMSILKGAVYFGLDPDVVEERFSRMTYGVGVLHRFDPERHPKEKLVSKDGIDWCTDIFDAFVRVNQPVALGESIVRRYTPVRRDQSVTVIHIYSTEHGGAEFVTDASVTRCGTLTLKLDENNAEFASRVRREIRTAMMFGDTEIKVRATDVTMHLSVEASIDFMNS